MGGQVGDRPETRELRMGEAVAAVAEAEVEDGAGEVEGRPETRVSRMGEAAAVVVVEAEEQRHIGR